MGADNISFLILIFMVGLCVGSFLNVIICRLPENKSIVAPPSHCPRCGHRLTPIELIPVISFIIQQGRCRSCGEKISLQYPLVELLTGILFLMAYLRTGFTLTLIKELILMPVLIAVTFIDLKHLIIPDKIVIFTAATGIFFALISRSNVESIVCGALIPAGILLLLGIISRGGIGGGDIKFMFAMGFFLGWLNLLALVIGWLLGGIAVLAMWLSGKKGRKDMIAFGPYLAAGCLVIDITAKAGSL